MAFQFSMDNKQSNWFTEYAQVSAHYSLIEAFLNPIFFGVYLFFGLWFHLKMCEQNDNEAKNKKQKKCDNCFIPFFSFLAISSSTFLLWNLVVKLKFHELCDLKSMEKKKWYHNSELKANGKGSEIEVILSQKMREKSNKNHNNFWWYCHSRSGNRRVQYSTYDKWCYFALITKPIGKKSASTRSYNFFLVVVVSKLLKVFGCFSKTIYPHQHFNGT